MPGNKFYTTYACITARGSEIGDCLYLSTGAKITVKVCMGNNICVAANAVVNKSFTVDRCLPVGIPAKFLKHFYPCYIRDGFSLVSKVNKIEELKDKFGV